MVEWIEIFLASFLFLWPLVSTLVVEWIEIIVVTAACWIQQVSTLVVEWIEIQGTKILNQFKLSPPSWWSGLK